MLVRFNYQNGMLFKIVSLHLQTLFTFQWVGSIDLANNDEADANILVPTEGSWAEQVVNY